MSAAACCSAATQSIRWRAATSAPGTVAWGTPPALYFALDREFSFTIDAAADESDPATVPLAERHFTREQDALAMSWAGERVFCNPPFGRDLDRWTRKALFEATEREALVVYLLPARTGVQWFHEYCLHRAEIRFLRGRLKYRRGGAQLSSAPFDSMIVIWRPGDTMPRPREMSAQRTFGW